MLKNPLKYLALWRKGWDSNPRGTLRPLAVFKTAALNHSATLPHNDFNGLGKKNKRIQNENPNWHPIGTQCLKPSSQGSGEGALNSFGSTIIGPEQVCVDP